MTKNDLIDFENEIASLYEKGLIKAPIHLRGGNEIQLIEIFKQIRQQDRVCCSWASHLECLLHNVPKQRIIDSILDRKSITLCFSDYKIISSGIVAGICPIALGFAWAAKLKNLDEITYTFIGDMTFLNGVSQECIRYGQNHNLPIKFVVADNGLSVKTPTKEVWGLKDGELEQICKSFSNVIYYKYTNTYPHSGINKFINLW